MSGIVFQMVVQAMLLSRLRNLLQMYKTVTDIYSTFNSYTLNLVMKVYTTCGSANWVVGSFEEVFDLVREDSARKMMDAECGFPAQRLHAEPRHKDVHKL